jgi:PAS domain S-box-containing protein
VAKKDRRPGNDAPSASSGQALRRRAEEFASENAVQSPEDPEAMSPEEARRTLHELRVHQVELEMQNEELRRAQLELDATRARYFDLYDLAPVGYCTLSEQGLILEANLTAATLLGAARGALVKQPISRFILDADEDIYYLHRKLLFEFGEPQSLELRMLKKDGTAFWAHLAATAAQDANGAPVCRVVLSDTSEQRSAQEALIASELRYAAIFEGTAESILIAEVATMRIRWVNSAACALLGYTRDELLQLTVHDIYPVQDLPTVLDQYQAFADGRITAAKSVPCRRKDGTVLLADIKGSRAVVDGVACNIGFFTDVTEVHQLEVQERKLAQAVDQTSEAILITGPTAEIEYANPAFERLSGLRHGELVGGRTGRIGTPQSAATFAAMWETLSAGGSWLGDLIHRRGDGTERVAEAAMSPVRDADGTVTGFVAIERDVTDERTLAQRSIQLARERALIAETIRGLRAGDTPEATAQAICRRVVTLTGVTAASLLLLGFDGHAWPIGLVVEGQPDPRLRRVPLQRSRHLRERATEGPWIEPWVNQPGHPYNQLFEDLGIHSIACAPVRHDGDLIGLLVADAKGSVEEVAVAEALPALVEFADLAGALIGRDVAERTEVGRGRDHVSGIIAHRAFGPVFQPIVELRHNAIVGYEAITRFANSNAIVGYEALTRFTDGSDPEVLFVEAAAVGLGAELETATLQAALEAAESLPGSAWLNLNASPDLIMAGEPLRTLLAGSSRRLVLEVTEHTAIADYPAFRAAMDALGPKVGLAVDDAGAGFASLRHVLELHPAFVKLDRSLVAGIESDEARHAMVVGLNHFARATGCRLIAEGIETDSEFAVLRALDIPLGQGYLLGRPLPVGGA